MRRSTVRKRKKRQARVRRHRARKVSFSEALHQFLTPQVWKQGHQAWQSKHSDSSWSLKGIIWTLLLMVFGKGDSNTERFLKARSFFVSRHDHEKRPGASWEGFQKALRRLPVPVFRALAAGLRQPIGQQWIESLRIGGWLPMGCGPRTFT